MNVLIDIGFISIGFVLGIVIMAVLTVNGPDEPLCKCGEVLKETEPGHYKCVRCE